MAVCYDAVDEVKGPVACKKKELRSYEIVYMTKEAKPFILFISIQQIGQILFNFTQFLDIPAGNPPD